jgi:hypothetical protein
MRAICFAFFAVAIASAQVSADEARKLAEEAYIFGYPLVLMETTGKVSTNRRGVPGAISGAPLNQFAHAREFPKDGFRTVIRPNADTLYSSAWLDLSKEPFVMHLPEMKDRYYLVQLMDGWTDSFSMPGTRTTGNRPGDYAIVGPGWKGKLPKGVVRIDSPTNLVWALGRIQTNSAADYANVHEMQKGFSLKPLSAFDRNYTPPDPGPADPSVDMRTTPPMQVAKMDAAAFFARLNDAMLKSPPHKEDAPVMERLKKIGIEPGKKFDPPAELRAAIDEGAKAAAAKLLQPPPREVDLGPGWTTSKVGVYGTDYLKRAIVARFGLGANPPEDAVYGQCGTDGDGKPFDGANRYIIHFPKGMLPPVNAFWSLTMYSPEGYFVKNPIDRFAIGDRDKLAFNPDGSLDLYLQKDAPAGKESNWLPAPEGRFLLSLRMYWPKAEVLNGKWQMQPVKRVN